MPPLAQRSPVNCRDCEYRSLRIFCNLSSEAIEDLNSIGKHVNLPKGTVLFQEEDPSQDVCILCEGQVKLSCTSRNGKTLILKIAVPGDVLGLGAVISNTPYEVTAEAIEPIHIKKLHKETFLAFLERHGEVSMHAAQSLSEEYKTAFFDAKRLALAPSAAGRLASVLLEWGRSACCGQPVMKFTMSVTHEELANLAGTSRETVTRALGRMQKQKLILIKGSSITILSPEKLLLLS